MALLKERNAAAASSTGARAQRLGVGLFGCVPLQDALPWRYAQCRSSRVFAMSTVTKERNEPMLPPDESFWQRYSPHHEFSLAAMTSFFVHGLVVGIMCLWALGVLWYLFQGAAENRKPPSMDVVQIS